MTISQLQNIQHFIARDLADVIPDVSRQVTLDPESGRKTTGDAAYVVIKTAFNTYKLSVLSAYVEPPVGAPVACKSLGTVAFWDDAERKSVLGPKADATWSEISRHVHVRELTDAIAAARRELAEANPKTEGDIRARLTVLAERGKKWGIEVKGLPPEPPKHGGTVMFTVPAGSVAQHPLNDPKSYIPPEAAAAAIVTTIAPDATTSLTVETSDGLYIGCPIIFVTNPGEAISGMSEIAGVCLKLGKDGEISALVMPDHSEPLYRDKLARRSEMHCFNCWDFNPAHVRQQARIRHLEEAIAMIADEGNELVRRVLDLEEQMKAKNMPASPPPKPPPAEAKKPARTEAAKGELLNV